MTLDHSTFIFPGFWGWTVTLLVHTVVLDMLKTIGLQLGVLLVVVAVAGGWVGAQGAISALIGGASYLIPNLLFVLRLKIATAAGRASAVTFFAGEFFKVAATIGILIVAQKFYDVHWLALLVGLFAALKANLFAFLLKT